jgi:pilus assembly protein CpaC
MRLHLTAILLIVLLSAGSTATAQTPRDSASGSSDALPPNTQSNPPQTDLPMAGDEETLHLFVGRSMVVVSPEPLLRVSVTDPAIASAVVVSPKQIMIHGIKPGTVSLLLWDAQEQLRTFGLQVLQDIRPIVASLKQAFPKENIEVSQSGAALVLAGEVSSQTVADRAVALAQTGATAVVNLLKVPAPVIVSSTVMLQVRFAEVDRGGLQDLGISLFSTGAGNTIGATTTQQFGSLAASAGAVPANVQRGTDPDGNSLVAGAIGKGLIPTPAVFGLSDLLNIFIFRSDVNLGLVVRALQQHNLLQILAEPNLLAASGKEASFLAGGEFPFPVVQGTAGTTYVTIEWKEFGVRLKFTATPQADGMIRLKVAPEVSSLDYTNALTISGFLVPALSTRRADTEVELKDGQSFAIAGLIDNRLTEMASQIPWLGNIPILGNLFKSRSVNRSKTELMVMVTPTIVKPLDPGQTPSGPQFPLPFMENQKFDGKVGETQPQETPEVKK